MSKGKKGNREAKKPKQQSAGTKKQQKDRNKHDEPVISLFDHSHEQ